MGEIDDWYKQEEEALEEEFFESVKKGKDQKKALSDYEKKADRLRKKFKVKYDRQVEKDMKKAKNPKIKKVKKEKFKHLEIEHFDFKFNWWQRKKRVWAWRFFRLNRKRKLFVERFVSAPIVYWYYKIIKKIKRSWQNIKSFISGVKNGAIGISIKIGIWILELMKKIYNYLKTKVIAVIAKLRKKKKDDKKEGEEGSEKDGEESGDEASGESGGDAKS